MSTCTYTRTHTHVQREQAPRLRAACHLGPDPLLWPSWMLPGQQTHLGQQGRERGRDGVAEAPSGTFSQEQKQQAVQRPRADHYLEVGAGQDAAPPSPKVPYEAPRTLVGGWVPLFPLPGSAAKAPPGLSPTPIPSRAPYPFPLPGTSSPSFCLFTLLQHPTWRKLEGDQLPSPAGPFSGSCRPPASGRRTDHWAEQPGLAGGAAPAEFR